jgi:hypothetical protein
MGLQVFVFCDCVEKKRLKHPHPFPRLLYIAPNGSPEIRSRDVAKIEQHDEWMLTACKHEGDMMAGGDDIGNAWWVTYLQEALSKAVKSPSREFPVIWHKVIFCGTHTGDHLTIRNVLRLKNELIRLRKVNLVSAGLDKDERDAVKGLIKTLADTVRVSIRLNKPVAF